jgi:two-component system OmpR family response regulator
VQRRARAVELTGTEFELLRCWPREPHKVFSRDDILNRLRGHAADLHSRAVDILVSRLRRKLEPLDGDQDAAQRRLRRGARWREGFR